MTHGDVEIEAIQWLVKIKTARSLDGFWDEFQEWLKDPLHRAAYLRVERAWNLIEEAIALLTERS